MSVQRGHYAFDGLPVREVPSGTNLLVTGPALGGIRGLVLRMLVRRHPREGALLVAADTGGAETLSEYEALADDVDPVRVGVVDCTGEGGEDADRNLRTVGSPGDLTGVGIEFSSLYESLHENGATRVRTGVYTLTPFVLYASPKPVFRFVHTLTGRIRTADGLGVCAIDPGTVDDKQLSALSQAFDGRVDLRGDDDGCAVRVRGLPDQPDGWQSIDLGV
ncbi:MAG: hypothetical protein ABEJ40_04100 [Haloarculaceae archaeon]